ncbi:cytochrome c3 family protein [Parahaliea mediterranea]|uniref:Cytochrome c3 family protein n=1 Tax=Parahaliea mediterranea TaxID=651086 RepID=A0A939DBP0_9GAMM|nr:cytochrome c3 family protein [Parahaliea mediterranea]MBN7795298.1 cytochrome c3 family protein [Parahaliea mediterranea]
MKTLLGLLALTGILVVILGSPIAGPQPKMGRYYGSPAPILPMTFAHADHGGINCANCHHNFVDDSGSGPCMSCHVTSEQLWPSLERQFHHLCRGCHVEKAALGEQGGPTRQCIACHLGDERA